MTIIMTFFIRNILDRMNRIDRIDSL